MLEIEIFCGWIKMKTRTITYQKKSRKWVEKVNIFRKGAKKIYVNDSLIKKLLSKDTYNNDADILAALTFCELDTLFGKTISKQCDAVLKDLKILIVSSPPHNILESTNDEK